MTATPPTDGPAAVKPPVATYGQTYAWRHKIVGVSGIIGAGKTALVKALAQALGWQMFAEPVKKNTYLPLFYAEEMRIARELEFYKNSRSWDIEEREKIPPVDIVNRYGYTMQVYLLKERFCAHQRMVWAQRNGIADRTIYEDVIFAKMLHDVGHITDLDFEAYTGLFDAMANFLHRPDVIVYLDVSPEVALKRIRRRGRACEQGMPLDYLVALRNGYEDWLKTGLAGRIPVIRVPWNDEGLAYTDAVVSSVAQALQNDTVTPVTAASVYNLRRSHPAVPILEDLSVAVRTIVARTPSLSPDTNDAPDEDDVAAPDTSFMPPLPDKAQVATIVERLRSALGASRDYVLNEIRPDLLESLVTQILAHTRHTIDL